MGRASRLGRRVGWTTTMMAGGEESKAAYPPKASHRQRQVDGVQNPRMRGTLNRDPTRRAPDSTASKKYAVHLPLREAGVRGICLSPVPPEAHAVFLSRFLTGSNPITPKSQVKVPVTLPIRDSRRHACAVGRNRNTCCFLRLPQQHKAATSPPRRVSASVSVHRDARAIHDIPQHAGVDR